MHHIAGDRGGWQPALPLDVADEPLMPAGGYPGRRTTLSSPGTASMELSLRNGSAQSVASFACLYDRALPATRTGALYNAFSYPTKISPETIALFIAAHTKPGDTVLDTFGGSGTTGLAALLCSNPPPDLQTAAESLRLPVAWGPRNAIVYELSTVGAHVARTLCNPPNAQRFLTVASNWISRCEAALEDVYALRDSHGHSGKLRHAIWTEILVCPSCTTEVSLWAAAVRLHPTVSISSEARCPWCGRVFAADDALRAIEQVWDPVLERWTTQRKRRLARIYGRTGNHTWSREPTAEDEAGYHSLGTRPVPASVPRCEIPWGDLYRGGYHFGITHAHHFYTRRNLVVLGTLWDRIDDYPSDIRDALRMLMLSYNATHSTLMTRIVVKQNQRDFVITGAQSGVLYVSGLPVEKNIFEGLRRKAITLARGFETVTRCSGRVRVVQASSTALDLPDGIVDYVFTDPPFGDFIPYAEVNFLNEVWLGQPTNRGEEIVISRTQDKTRDWYERMLTDVFREVARVLKDDGKATVVFHAARAEVWKALQSAYEQAGLAVEQASVLDKVQGSFKQVTSTVSVKGDPLLLLSKASGRSACEHTSAHRADLDPSLVLEAVVAAAARSDDAKELEPERLYSRFVGYYLEFGQAVPLHAADFYPLARARIMAADLAFSA